MVEALDDEREEERPIFFFLEGEGDDAGEQVNEHEGGEENQRADDVFAGPERGKMGDAELGKSPEDNGEEEQEIDHRRDERKQNLEQENVGKSNPAKRAVALAANGVAMLPDGLQSAVSPTEALANESVHGVGDFGAADGVFVIKNFPAVA